LLLFSEEAPSRGSMKRGLRGFQNCSCVVPGCVDSWGLVRNCFMFVMIRKRSLILGLRAAAWSARHCWFLQSATNVRTVDQTRRERIEMRSQKSLIGDNNVQDEPTKQPNQISRPSPQPPQQNPSTSESPLAVYASSVGAAARSNGSTTLSR